jgi:hypothetical protein
MCLLLINFNYQGSLKPIKFNNDNCNINFNFQKIVDAASRREVLNLSVSYSFERQFRLAYSNHSFAFSLIESSRGRYEIVRENSFDQS